MLNPPLGSQKFLNGIPVYPQILGGSGRYYNDLATAQAGETEQSAADTTAAGTTAGSVTLTGPIPAWLSVGDMIELTDLTPGNGLVCRYAMIKAIAGLVLTIDQPWDFGVGETVTLFRPIRLYAEGDLAGNFTGTKNLVLDGACRIRGTVTVSGGVYCEMKGVKIDQGVIHQVLGALVMRDCDVSLNPGAIYAVLLTSNVNHGAFEAYNSRFDGCWASRRGYFRLVYINNTCNGVAQTDQNCPGRCVESVAGVAIVAVDIHAIIDGECAGAIFYSENNLTGPAVQYNVKGNIWLPNHLTGTGLDTQMPVGVSLWWAVGGATLTMTPTAASEFIGFVGCSSISPSVNVTEGASLIRAVNFSGTITVTLTNNPTTCWNASPRGTSACFIVYTVGSAVCSGSITMTGGFPLIAGFSPAYCVAVNSAFTGSVTVSSSLLIYSNGGSYVAIRLFVAQAAGAPTITISGASLFVGTASVTTFSLGAAVSVGTYTLSGAYSGERLSSWSNTLTTNAQGGTWVVSGSLTLSIVSFSPGSFALASVSSNTPGVTLTVSGATVLVSFTGFYTTVTLSSCTGTGSVCSVTAASIVMRGAKANSASTLITATTATSTATVTGTVQFEECEFAGAVTIGNATAVGGVAQLPQNLRFYNSVFESTWNMYSAAGLGTITIAALSANWESWNCTFRNTITINDGGRFNALNYTNCNFESTAVGNAINVLLARPTQYMLIHPKMSSNFGAYLSQHPDIVLEDIVIPTDVAGPLAIGQPVNINIVPAAAVAVAASVIRGTALRSDATNTWVMIRGFMSVRVDSATVPTPGLNLVLDILTPDFTRYTVAGFTPSQNAGTSWAAAVVPPPGTELVYAFVDHH